MLASRNICLMLLLMAPFIARADDNKKVDASGTWKWFTTGRNGGKTSFILKLKQDGDKVTGTLNGYNGQIMEVKDGSVKDGQVTFTVMRKRNGGDDEIPTTYSGTVDGDQITGTVDSDGGSREWQATRFKDPT